MIRVRQIKINVENDNIKLLYKKVATKLNISVDDINTLKINKKSIDARQKPTIFYIYEVDIETDKKVVYSNDVLEIPNEDYIINVTGNTKLNNRIIIVGSGPSGLFATYMLTNLGYKVLLIERGECVENRVKTVDEFWLNNKLNINSNVQFGEGGAGTFSDGKLNTMVKDPKHIGKKVFSIFVENGANEEILYLNKPHLGTDNLVNIVKNMRNKIISNGGEILYNSCLTDIVIKDSKIKQIVVNNKDVYDTDVLVLALGHSARDTFKMLYDKKINMESKPFAIGVRVQHNQDSINKSQYGNNKLLPNADYKLTYKSKNNRGVYSFCMCPGGYVVNASSENNELAINGMSYSARDSSNANSAIVVTVNPSDFGTNPLDGIKFQQQLEHKTYLIGKGLIPTQLFKDYKNNTISSNFKDIKPVFKGNYTFANLNDIFPSYINESLKEGIDYFNNKIKGFNKDDVILSAIESRTSSPIRIVRDDNYESNIKGIYPIGEGAGYSGGITSSAMDGLKLVEHLVSIYNNK